MHFVVGAEQALGHRAEQRQHGQVLLGVPAVDRRIDEPRPAVRAEEHVAPPQVAVHESRATGREQFAETGGDCGHRALEPAPDRQRPQTGTVEGGAVRGGRRVDGAGPDPRRPPAPAGPAGHGAARPAPFRGSLRDQMSAPPARPPVVTRSPGSASTTSGTGGATGHRTETPEPVGLVEDARADLDHERPAARRHHPHLFAEPTGATRAAPAHSPGDGARAPAGRRRDRRSPLRQRVAAGSSESRRAPARYASKATDLSVSS